MSEVEGHRQKTLNIPEDLLERFESLYPMRGAFTWFVVNSLEVFVELHELSPGEEVQAAVRLVLSNTDNEVL